MLPKFSLSLVLLVYTGRLIDTKSILLLRGISKSVRPRQTVPCPGARRRLIQGREKYLIIKFSQYFLKFWLIYLDTFYPQSRVEESANYLQRFFLIENLRIFVPPLKQRRWRRCVPSRVPSVTSPARGLATTEDWGRLEAPTIPSRGRPAPNRFRGCSVLYCTVLYCTVLYCNCDLPVVASPLICNASDK